MFLTAEVCAELPIDYMLALVLSVGAFFGPARPLAAGPARLAASLRSAGPRLSYESAAEDKKAAEALEQANKMVDSFVDMLGDLTPPPSLMALKDAIGEGELAAVRVAQYVLLIDQTLDYDLDEATSKVSVLTLDFTKTDDEVLVTKMRYLYTYGIKMYMAEMVTQDELQAVVLEKLASRVNMDGAALDQWLEVPAVV